MPVSLEAGIVVHEFGCFGAGPLTVAGAAGGRATNGVGWVSAKAPPRGLRWRPSDLPLRGSRVHISPAWRAHKLKASGRSMIDELQEPSMASITRGIEIHNEPVQALLLRQLLA